MLKQARGTQADHDITGGLPYRIYVKILGHFAASRTLPSIGLRSLIRCRFAVQQTLDRSSWGECLPAGFYPLRRCRQP